MKKLVVVMCVYNEYGLAKRSIEALLENTTGECDIILVDNHSFDRKTRKYLEKVQNKKNRVKSSNYPASSMLRLTAPDTSNNILVVDPGENLGCHGGWNYAVMRANPLIEKECQANYEFIAKVDDDTIVAKGWNAILMNMLERNPLLGFLAALDRQTRQGAEFRTKKVDGGEIEIPRKGVVSFACVMFPGKSLERIGLLTSEGVSRRTRRSCGPENLFGGEEQNYLRRTRQAGREGAYLGSWKLNQNSVYAQHIPIEERRDHDFLLWKFWYGYLGRTQKEFCEWRRSRKDKAEAYAEVLISLSNYWKEIALRKLMWLGGWEYLETIDSATPSLHSATQDYATPDSATQDSAKQDDIERLRRRVVRWLKIVRAVEKAWMKIRKRQ